MSDTPTLTENLPTELREQAGWNRDDAGLAGALLAAGVEIERLRAENSEMVDLLHRSTTVESGTSRYAKDVGEVLDRHD